MVILKHCQRSLIPHSDEFHTQRERDKEREGESEKKTEREREERERENQGRLWDGENKEEKMYRYLTLGVVCLTVSESDQRCLS